MKRIIPIVLSTLALSAGAFAQSPGNRQASDGRPWPIESYGNRH